MNLTRPSSDDVQLAVYLATRNKEHPSTLADIRRSLDCKYYMHDLARAVWQLASKGTIAVRSGHILNFYEF